MELSLDEARRLALSAQGFGHRRATPRIGDVTKIASRVLAVQIDSINVLVRSHYLPAYSRLGPYPMATIDRLAYEGRELFEDPCHVPCPGAAVPAAAPPNDRPSRRKSVDPRPDHAG